MVRFKSKTIFWPASRQEPWLVELVTSYCQKMAMTNSEMTRQALIYFIDHLKEDEKK